MDTKLYYLQTRYYDPETGRFINADDISYLDPETLGGLNLYAYCGNNPVIHYDPTGEIVLLCLLIGLLVGAVAGAVAGGVTAYNAAKDSGATGWELFGWTLLGVFGGAVIGGAFGALAGAGIGLGLGILGAGISALGAMAKTIRQQKTAFIKQTLFSIFADYVSDDPTCMGNSFSAKLLKRWRYRFSVDKPMLYLYTISS
ncbi:MAG: RHS repeat-associated core domain-containing protein [Corallococcus sp.]|nr:RHS repeat-associated core domain-containing protein [Corallococcus sp.]MCM1358963.1 RHS repeat-associated core domain-containing protein [Corallococcus sp.]MCM1394952.1 RHS repeat-associated core domain-containing protein [Corallococcus sp.]